MVRVCPDESKELPQQDTVGGFVPAVLNGQGLEQGEGAAPVAGDVPAPVREQECYTWQQEADPTTTNPAVLAVIDLIKLIFGTAQRCEGEE